MFVYLRSKFQVSSIILTSSRQGVILPLATPESKTQNCLLRLRLTIAKSFISSIDNDEVRVMHSKSDNI